jgi:hypothetical protein
MAGPAPPATASRSDHRHARHVHVGSVGWFIYQDFRAGAELKAELTAGTYTYDDNSDDGRDHVPNRTYEVNPPAGGAHVASPAPVGSTRDSRCR